jgi:hypothetical protein
MKEQLPLLYRWVRAHGTRGLTPWHFLDQDRDRQRIQSLRKEYALEVGGTPDILPFAVRQDMDTIAGFVFEAGVVKDVVVTVHLTWAGKKELPGWPAQGPQQSFQQWVTEVLIADAAEWMSEEDLEEILNP